MYRLEAHGVDIRDARPAHLVYFDRDRDLQPIILANCNYSLEVGKGSSIEYDFKTMEKQVEERFIWGRPRLQFQVITLTDICCLSFEAQPLFWMLQFDTGVLQLLEGRMSELKLTVVEAAKLNS